jgi:hypothetical protein
MTNLGNPGYGSFFEEQKQKHFDRLCRNLHLEGGLGDSGNGYAIVSAGANNVRVFFEHERGLCTFAVGALADVKPLCGVDELASRFPRIRAMPGGYQRLDLDEQREFLEAQWSDLQVMFSPDHITETRAWYRAAATAHTEDFSRK